MNTKKTYLILPCLFLFFTIIPFVPFVGGISEIYFNANYWSFSRENISFLSNFLNDTFFERIQEHVKYFGSLKSRVTGYPGCNSAANYIINFFNNISKESPKCGAKILIQDYEVLVPIDANTSVAVIYPENKTVEAYTIWPNLIQTSPLPPEGIQGTLIYVGEGDLKEFNNKTIKDSVVLMDFDSGDNWINAAKLGAKAVIFIENPNMNYYNSIKKFLLTPIHFPRLYVSLLDGDYLKNLINRSSSPPIVIVKSRMVYQSVVAKNVIMEIPGEINDTIVIGAHYDAWSIVPALAPGADESTGISTLLELARFFASHKPYRTVVFAALSGYWQALAGSRAFTEQYIFSEEVVSGLRKINMFIGLDFSTDNDEIAFLIAGHAFKVLVDDSSLTKPLNNEFALRYSNLGTLIRDIINMTEVNFNRSYNVDVAFRSDGWWARIPVPYMLDSEPVSATGIIAFTIRTDNCYRIGWGTPLSIFEKVSFENLKPQVEVGFMVVFELANRKDVILPSYVPQRITVTGSIRTGCVTVKGKSLFFNCSRGWYEPLPNAIIHMPLKAVTYPFAHIITHSDANGEFVIYSVVTNLGGSPYFAQFGSKAGYPVMAYFMDDKYGFIEYAPDAGIYGSRQIDFYVKASNHPYMTTTVSFKCSAIELYDLYDFERITNILVTDPRFTDTNLASTPVEFQVFDFKSYSAFSSFSYIYFGFEHVGIAFIPQNQRFSLSLRLGVARKLAVLLLNTSRISEGEGYYSFSGEKKLIFNAFDYASDIFRLVSSRYNMLCTFLVRDAMSEVFFNNARERLNKAILLIQQKKYDLAYKEILSALSWSIALYDSTFNLINGVAYNTIILFSVVVPFTLLFEELIFSAKGRGKIISLILVGFTAILAFYTLHPGMKILSNALISLLGIVICLLLLIISVLFGDKVLNIFRTYRKSLMGTHFEFSRTGITSTLRMCFRYSVQNMKRRKSRTILVMSSITIIVLSLTSLSSITITLSPRENIVFEGETFYNGLLIKRAKVVTLENLLSDEYIDNLFSNFTIAKRSWYYMQTYQNRRVESYIKGRLGIYNIKALIGLMPEENLLKTISLLEGRFFQSFDYYSCIIPMVASEKMGVKIGDIIVFGGIPLRVVGIYEPQHLSSVVDIDGRELTPIRPEDLPAISHQQLPRGVVTQYIPLSWENLIIVPYKLSIDLGAFVSSVVVKIDKQESIQSIAKDLALNFEVQPYASYNGTTVVYSRASLFPTMGLEMMLIPIIVGFMTVLMTALGNVHERRSEIFILNCIGVSPMGVSLIFIVEALFYSIVGISIGYLTGLGINALLFSCNLLPRSFYPNFTAISISIIIGLSLLSTLLSTLYPSLVASKLAIPSLRRKWTIPTSPRGNIWEIPLPFVLKNRSEAEGLLIYLTEYFNLQTSESLGEFLTRNVDFSISKMELNVNMYLLPIDLQVSQNLKINFEKKNDEYIPTVVIAKVSGSDSDWIALNRRVIMGIREQILTWYSLSMNEKNKYLAKAREKSN